MPSIVSLAESATGVSCDHRRVAAGNLFFEIPGAHFDPIHERASVRSRGAAIVGERPGVDHQVTDVREAYAQCCAAFYRYPSRGMKVVGVTGTSGKTTTTYLIEAILEAAGLRVGVIGTINIRYLGKVREAEHTTPMAGDLQQILTEMKTSGVQAVVMEVSSHALKQRRVGAVDFDVAVFTNLTPEHMDYHPTLEDYFLSKARLFEPGAVKPLRSVVCRGTPHGDRLVAQLRDRGQQVEEFGSDSGLRLSPHGIEGDFRGVRVRSPLEGEFNRLNVMGAILAAEALGIDPASIALGLARLKGVPGRMERVRGAPEHAAEDPKVYVDYAHKPDALEKVLESLRHLSSEVVTVFGCGGDRDRTKRPVMGKIAAQLSQSVIVTSDNPRTEDPQAIIAEIVAGIPSELRAKVEVQADRRLAIRDAIRRARTSEVVLIAGKGHEDYQIIGTTKISMSDVTLAEEALRSRHPGHPHSGE